MRCSSLPFVGFVAVLCFLLLGFSFASDGGLRDAVPMVFGSVWHVSTSGNDLTGDGSQGLPFRTIQKGIDSADDGDTVLVEWGVYVENINFSGKRILVASHYIFDGLESTIESTIINGGHAGSVVTFNSGEGLNSVIRGFTLTGGYAVYGGGVYCYGSSPTISENFIVGNACAWGTGGPGIYCGHGSSPTIYRNLVADCSGPAAIFLFFYSGAQVINNTVCDNTWGGISIQASSNAYVKNNIFCNNVDYGIHVASGSSWYVGYNDVFGQNNNYVGDIGDQTGIEGNISADPLFENPSAGDYHLALGSPCIDAGDPPGVDMGAFECSWKGVVGNEPRPQSFTLLQNYPNPFNPHTQIDYLLPGDQHVRITVFNSLGQRVKILVDEHQTAGRKNVWWDGRDEQGSSVASGVYFCRMEVADLAQTRKMLLVK